MQKILLTLLLLLSFQVWKAEAQSSQDRWTSYLEPGAVNGYLDEADKLYMATDAGVFVMDKATHTVLEHWTKQSVGIPSNRVESIRRDPATHRIFIGTYDIAALAAQNADGSWETIPYPEEVLGASEFNPVMTYCIEFDDQNRLWVGTSHGLLRYDADGAETWHLFNESNTTNFFRSVWDMDKDSQGRLLFGGNLLYRSAGDGIELISPLGPNGNVFGELFSYSDAKIHAQSDGTIWFFTDVGSYGRYDGTNWTVTASNESPVSFHQLDFLTEDPQGVLWADLGWQGFAHFNAQTGAWETGGSPVPNSTTEDPIDVHFLGTEALVFTQGKLEWYNSNGSASVETELGSYPFEGSIWRMKTDHEGNLWSVESGGGGRLRNLESGDLITLTDNNGEQLYIADYAFTNEGKLWAISGKRVLYQTDNGWGFFDYTNSELPDSYGFSNLTIDSYGRVWIAVYEKGLYRYDSVNGWKRFNNPQLVQHYIMDIAAGQDGQVWVSTWYTNNVGTRLCLIDDTNFTVFNPNLTNANASFNKMIFDEQTGRLYAGGTALGYWIDGAWHNIDLPVDFGTSQYITALQIVNDRIFLATRESVLLFDGTEWTVFTPDNSPLQRLDIYDTGYDLITGRVWIAYNTVRAVDVYQTDFLVNGTTPGNHPNPFAVKISPNPATNQVFVNYETLTTAAQVTGRIYNMQGALLRSFEWDGSVGQHKQMLDLSGLEAGSYVVEITAGELTSQARLLKL